MDIIDFYMIYIASDHGGFQLKKYLTRFLKLQLKREVEDMGPFEYDENDDYPIFAHKLAKKIATDASATGILICKTGHGVCMMANKMRKVRAILGYNIEAAEWGRRDENANILCLAAKFVSDEHAGAIVKKFLETDFENAQRHVRRLAEINKLDDL